MEHYQNDGNNQLFSNLLIRFADKSYPLSLTEAITALKAGRFVLVHDDKGRENEVDMVVPAEQVKPHHIATMRNDAGGLVCLADRKSTRLNSSHRTISYAVFCL